MKVRRWVGSISAALLVAGAGGVMLFPTTVAAATVSPTTTADDGAPGSLRYLLEKDVDPGDTVVLAAGATYELTRCAIGTEDPGTLATDDGDIEIQVSVTIQGNGATIRQTCPGYRVIYSDADLTLDGVTITGGTSTFDGGGGGVRLDEFENLTLVVRNSMIVGNCTGGSGGGFKMNTSGDVQIINSTIANNIADDNGGGVSLSHDTDLLIVNSTVSNNTADYAGGVEVRNGDLTTVYSDIVDNTVTGVFDNCGVNPTGVADEAEDAQPEAVVDPANLAMNGEFEWNTFATVVALPHGGTNCYVATVTIGSSGYNFADDLTCNFPVGTDKQGTGAGFDPLLSALASNGGPTQTRLPQTGSPLINSIPLANCGDGNTIAGGPVTTDQRGITRPQETGCEIGSVEIAAPPPVVVTPTFTG